VNKKLLTLIDLARIYRPERQTGQHFILAGAFKKNRLVGLGFNNYNKLHPYHKFGHYKPTRDSNANYKPSLHAECHLLSRLKHDPSEITFGIVRVNNKDEVALARCCENCLRVFKKVGYKTILYTVSEEEFGTIN
jgi:hypothetical protein